MEAMKELLQEKDRIIADLRRQVQEWVEQEGAGHVEEEEAPAGAILLDSESRCENGMSGGGWGSRRAEHLAVSQARGEVKMGSDEEVKVVGSDEEVKVGGSDEEVEVGELRYKVESLQSERSQLLSDLQVQREALRVCEGKQAQQQECTRYIRELERLKPHLIEVCLMFVRHGDVIVYLFLVPLASGSICARVPEVRAARRGDEALCEGFRRSAQICRCCRGSIQVSKLMGTG